MHLSVGRGRRPRTVPSRQWTVLSPSGPRRTGPRAAWRGRGMRCARDPGPLPLARRPDRVRGRVRPRGVADPAGRTSARDARRGAPWRACGLASPARDPGTGVLFCRDTFAFCDGRRFAAPMHRFKFNSTVSRSYFRSRLSRDRTADLDRGPASARRRDPRNGPPGRRDAPEAYREHASVCPSVDARGDACSVRIRIQRVPRPATTAPFTDRSLHRSAETPDSCTDRGAAAGTSDADSRVATKFRRVPSWSYCVMSTLVSGDS